MEHLDTDSEDKPINPPSLISAKVLINPFDDIIQRNKVNPEISKEKDEKIEKKEKTAVSKVKNISLLSFEPEEAEDNEEIQEKQQKIKIKSSHDALKDPKLSKEPAISIEKLEFFPLFFSLNFMGFF